MSQCELWKVVSIAGVLLTWTALAVLALPNAAQAATPTRQATQDGLDYISREVLKWQTDNSNCVGCHVQGASLATIAQGINRSFEVDTAVLEQILQRIQSKTLSSPRGAINAQGEGDDGTQPVAWVGFGLAQYQQVAKDAGFTFGGKTLPDKSSLLNDYAFYLAQSQETSGRVPATNKGAPPQRIEPPVLASADLDALQISAYAAIIWKQAGSAFSQNLSKVDTYLKSLNITASTLTQDYASMILGLLATGNTRQTGNPLDLTVVALLKKQNTNTTNPLVVADGGWGETDTLASNAYATGQAVYALRQAGVTFTTGDGGPIDRGINFLLSPNNRTAGGAWTTGATQSTESDPNALFTYTMWPVLALQELAAPVPKITLALTGCTTCRPGDRFKVEALVTNPNATNVPIEAKLGVRAPGDISVSLIGQCLVFPLPGGLRQTVPLLDITLPPGLPTGTWTFEGALLEPDLGVTLWRSVQPFEITK